MSISKGCGITRCLAVFWRQVARKVWPKKNSIILSVDRAYSVVGRMWVAIMTMCVKIGKRTVMPTSFNFGVRDKCTFFFDERI